MTPAPDRRPGGVDLIGVPYHLGRRGVGMGEGPRAILAGDDALRRLEAAGPGGRVAWIDDQLEADHEIGRTFELNRAVARRVGQARAAGALPIVCSGNCNSAIGVIAGISVPRLAVVWLDAHPDFETPETTTSGFFDGMGLAIVTGACWHEMRHSVPGFGEVSEDDVLLVGVRDMAEPEARRLEASSVAVVPPARIRGEGADAALAPALDRLAGADGAYLHVDLDVLDPSEGRANAYAVAGGLTREELLAAVAATCERLDVLGAAVTAYDPSCDPAGDVRGVALDVLAAVAASRGAA